MRKPTSIALTPQAHCLSWIFRIFLFPFPSPTISRVSLRRATCTVSHLSKVSSELAAVAKYTDLIILEGMGRALHTNLNAQFHCDALKQAALVLNASRHFRYTLDLRKEEEKEQKKSLIRAHAQVIRAALLFRLAGERELVTGATVTPPTPVGGDFAVGLEQLSSMSKDQNVSTTMGGASLQYILGLLTQM